MDLEYTKQQIDCQKRVIDCVEKNYIVKVMMEALRKHGCEVNLSRHLTCESCASTVRGGYDSVNKQVVICSNNCITDSGVCGTLAHELIHAFDDCRAIVDFNDINHLACSEVRAASLTDCSTRTAYNTTLNALFGKREHQNCVKWMARKSVLAVRNVSRQQATAAVDRVFDKCYNDLEPLGRVPQDSVKDGKRIYVEASLYGFTGVNEPKSCHRASHKNT